MQHRWLSSRASAEPGRYRTARTPYLRAIMDALSPGHPAQRISFMKAAQVGATEAGNNWIGFVIHHAPGPMLAVLPTVEMAKRSSRGRIDPLIEDSAALKERVKPARSRDAGNSMLSKEFPGGILVLTGANSATGLRSMPARYVFLDEVDAYPASADEEGDPVTLAEARTTTFAHRRKVFMVSTPDHPRAVPHRARVRGQRSAAVFRAVPALRGDAVAAVRAAALGEGPAGDRRLPLRGLRPPHCRASQDADAGDGANGGQQRQATDPTAIGFHLSALYSPIGWKSWAQIARDWLAAQGSDEMLRAARNTLLGETWVESGEAPDWQRLADRRETYPAQIPERGLFLTAGADVQKDRIEVDVWAWGRGLESWLVDHIVIAGRSGRSRLLGGADGPAGPDMDA